MDSIAQLFLKKGLADTGISVIGLNNIIEFGFASLSSWLVWLGILVYIVNFVLWLVIIYRIDLSIAMPVGSVAYAFVPIIAVIFLHEHVSPIRWLGIAMIVLGIYFTSQSKNPELAEGQKGDGAVCPQ
ncbi:MAG: EamA family transporter [Candidatus Omnitrophota bacterium]